MKCAKCKRRQTGGAPHITGRKNHVCELCLGRGLPAPFTGVRRKGITIVRKREGELR